jgi:hypothetical protein
MTVYQKPSMKNNYLAYPRAASPISWMLIYCPAAFDMYYHNWLNCASLEQVTRIAGLMSITLTDEKIVYVFPERTIALLRSVDEYRDFESDENLRNAITEIVCRMVIR